MPLRYSASFWRRANANALPCRHRSIALDNDLARTPNSLRSSAISNHTAPSMANSSENLQKNTLWSEFRATVHPGPINR
jgi:hypothetical protein